MTASADAPHRPGLSHRWNTYFSERFPPLQHGVLIASFTFGMLSYTARLASSYQNPTAVSYLVGSVTAFFLVLQLRIMDEFKNFEGDARWRPYQPAPRSLVSMPTLRRLWFIVAALEVASTLLLDARLILGLLLIWGYSGLVGMKFFIRPRLKSSPLVFLLSHSAIVALPGLTCRLKNGDWVEMAGTTGIVVRLAPRELTPFSFA